MADNFSELLALMAEQMRAADRDRADAARDREENMRRFEEVGRNFERMTQVMIAGFGRLEDKIEGVKQEVAGVKQEVASVKQEVAGLNQRVEVLTEEQRAMNRRLQATFDQTGLLTERAADTEMRLTRTEQQAAPTNAELDARLREVENHLRNAS